MHPTVSRPQDDRARPGSATLWLLAVAFFGVGDALTTGVGLAFADVSEANPVVAPLVRRSPVGAIVGTKVAVLAGSYLLWKRIPHPQRVGIPLGLAAVGIAVTAWNCRVLALATLS